MSRFVEKTAKNFVITQKTTNAWEQKKLGDMGSTYGGLKSKRKEDFIKGNSNYISYIDVFKN
ncbi:hypothetical protein, partial [Mycoplasma sp. HS2188]|uniref:hypothetical protein n=1 Tax=Mycoplasma sp. HS2188 TaxID=2976765 RepID=UPI0037C5FE68|nr:restriction endonuclease subunit S [Mycoplasma sp. HS2188]